MKRERKIVCGRPERPYSIPQKRERDRERGGTARVPRDSGREERDNIGSGVTGAKEKEGRKKAKGLRYGGRACGVVERQNGNQSSFHLRYIQYTT